MSGLKKRTAAWKPSRPAFSLRRFTRWIGHWLRRNVQGAIEPGQDLTLETYLASSNYTGAQKFAMKQRRDKLCVRKKWREEEYSIRVLRGMRPGKRGWKSADLKTFVKDEKHVDFKAPRLVNPRGDFMTSAMGPIVKAMEAIVYSIPMGSSQIGTPPVSGATWFVKHTPVRDGARARLIDSLRSRLRPGGCYVATDHTAFEGHFAPDVMRACEFQLYRWLCRRHPQALACIVEYERILTGLSQSDCGLFIAQLQATRQSGDLVTSLGNGFTNLMLMLYAGYLTGCEMFGFVEGDDGLFVVNPTRGVIPSKELFRTWGYDLKLEKIDDPSNASFCGNVYVPGEFRNLADPIVFLAKAPWYNASDCTQVNYHRARELLRAKAMSALAQYAGCPIIHTWALRALKDTAGSKPRYNLAGRTPYGSPDLCDVTDKIQQWARVPITEAARNKVAQVFHCDVTEQLRIEKQLVSGHDVTIAKIPAAWKLYSRFARV